MSKTRISAPEGVPFIDITREFDAPRDLVYRAYVEPDLLKQWLGPRKYEMQVQAWDARHGGKWAYTHSDEQASYGFRGVFHGDPSPDSITQTFEFDGWPGHVSLEHLRLEERDGRTIVHNHSVYQSVEDRDGMVASGMEEGVNEGYDRLDEVLEGLKAGAAAASR
jgi:uncharacterized protein YndB with AHSA1/START domain